MRLSLLQRFILLECREQAQSRLKRSVFLHYYENKRSIVAHKDQHDAVTKSVERLIDKGLLIGYGRRTPKKWFIEAVRLTPKGRKEATKLLGEQQELPLKSKAQSSKDKE